MIEVSSFLENVAFAILDVETTGFYPHCSDRICEIGVLRMRNGQEEQSFQSLLNPGRLISPGASRVNGITDGMVMDAPAFSAVINDILPLFQDACIVCHNAPFDLGFIFTEMEHLFISPFKNPVVDTLILARKHYNFPSNALSNIARYLDLHVDNVHRAMGDVLITKELLLYFIGELRRRKHIETLEDLLKLHY